MCDGIGDITAFRLISFLGSASEVFSEKSMHLSDISGIPANIKNLLAHGVPWSKVDEELNFIDKKGIKYTTVLDKTYPQSLLQTPSPPVILFHSGSLDNLHKRTCISIVGTRNCTPYGQEFVENLITEMKTMNISVISGLALGIDITAHRKAVKNTLPTYAIVGHGLKTIYPALHRNTAQEMINSGGGIITEFFSSEKPNRENFPKRNRIIAGLSTATLVIEASPKSGTLITADYALNFKRKVFALPGRYTDKNSLGCNMLLKNKQVKPIISIHDLLDSMGLKSLPAKPAEKKVPVLEPDEQLIFQLLQTKHEISIDNIASATNLQMNVCSSLLFNLEMQGLVRSLPGKTYGVA